MAKSGVSGIPVVDEDIRPMGLISENDFLYQMGKASRGNLMILIAECLKGKGCLAAPVRAKKAADLMSVPAITVTTETSARAIASMPIMTSSESPDLNRLRSSSIPDALPKKEAPHGGERGASGFRLGGTGMMGCQGGAFQILWNRDIYTVETKRSTEGAAIEQRHRRNDT